MVWAPRKGIAGDLYDLYEDENPVEWFDVVELYLLASAITLNRTSIFSCMDNSLIGNDLDRTFRHPAPFDLALFATAICLTFAPSFTACSSPFAMFA